MSLRENFRIFVAMKTFLLSRSNSIHSLEVCKFTCCPDGIIKTIEGLDE